MAPDSNFEKSKNVVDDAHQRIAAVENNPHPIALLAGQGRLAEQSRDAENAIERRSDLMAHHRQEG